MKQFIFAVSLLASSFTFVKAQWANLKIKSIECINTEDYTGDDGIFLMINNKKYNIGTMNNGDIEYPNISISFKDYITVELWEDDPDFLDGDDHLGTINPDYSDISARGNITQKISYGIGQRCKYEITYEVTPL